MPNREEFFWIKVYNLIPCLHREVHFFIFKGCTQKTSIFKRIIFARSGWATSAMTQHVHQLVALQEGKTSFSKFIFATRFVIVLINTHSRERHVFPYSDYLSKVDFPKHILNVFGSSCMVITSVKM